MLHASTPSARFGLGVATRVTEQLSDQAQRCTRISRDIVEDSSAQAVADGDSKVARTGMRDE